MNAPLSPWRLRARTGEAALEILRARALIAFVPFGRWRDRLGGMVTADADGPDAGGDPSPLAAEARRLARHVDRAAGRLPLAAKCLPRAIALARMLRRRGIPHVLVIAARPGPLRGGEDDLHAWIAVEGLIVLGNLPGPWACLLTLASG